MSDRLRAEFASRDLYRVSGQLAQEIRKRRAAEAEVARLTLEVDFVWHLLHEAEERAERTRYEGLLPEGLAA